MDGRRDDSGRGGAWSGGEAPIDLAHLARQTFGSQALERAVLDLFAHQARDLVAAIARTEGAERAAGLHRLKGSARGVGAGRIADLAEALEAPGLGEGERRDLIAALVAAETEARAFVQRFVATAGGAAAT